MIPIRLELQNFMSYGENVPPLEFSGLRTLCLSGDNGNGKSAILDAITWSLWGESRAGKNKHEKLVRLGSDEMSVIFTFMLDQQQYRVLRKHSKKASGNLWELQQLDDTGVWRSRTGNNAAETERSIHHLLRMSYDTFLNSAYLRQGHADQFVRQPPGKRKEILADILDLSRYDQLEEKARERSRAAGAEAVDYERDINGIDAELANEEGNRQQLTQVTDSLSKIRAAQEKIRQQLDLLKERQSKLQSQKLLSENLIKQEIALCSELQELQDEQAKVMFEKEQCLKLQNQEAEIRTSYSAYKESLNRYEQLTKNLAVWNEERQNLAQEEKRYLAASTEIQRKLDRAKLEHEQAELSMRDYHKLADEQNKIEQLLNVLSKSEALKSEYRQSLTEVQGNFDNLRDKNSSYEAQITHWKERIELLQKQEGRCEVCDTPLSQQKVLESLERYKIAYQSAVEEGKAVKKEASIVKAKKTTLEEQLRKLEEELSEQRALIVRKAQIDQNLLRLEETQKQLPHMQEVKERLELSLQNGDYAPEIKRHIAEIKSRIAPLQTVQSEIEQEKKKLNSLKDSESRYLQLQTATSSLQGIDERLQRLIKIITTRNSQRLEIQKQLSELQNVTSEMASIEEHLAHIIDEERQNTQQERTETENQIRLQHILQRYETLKSQRKKIIIQCEKARKDKEAYEQLSRAFGKKGVQALIIGNAIPELQEETNRLLERLSDSEMSIQFNMQRDAKAKKAEQIETLDILLSDNIGTRPLEMYSGGEGFRAAFAIRIALSKLLARRAGARLQTLIIDEGFGTQDGKGREKLIEALHVIQDEFDLIIVISHIDELKDAFASRIEVTKTPTGSQFVVLEGSAG